MEKEEILPLFNKETERWIRKNLDLVQQEYPLFASILLPALQEGRVDFAKWGSCFYGTLHKGMLAYPSYTVAGPITMSMRLHSKLGWNPPEDAANEYITPIDYYGVKKPTSLRVFLLQVLPEYLEKQDK